VRLYTVINTLLRQMCIGLLAVDIPRFIASLSHLELREQGGLVRRKHRCVRRGESGAASGPISSAVMISVATEALLSSRLLSAFACMFPSDSWSHTICDVSAGPQTLRVACGHRSNLCVHRCGERGLVACGRPAESTSTTGCAAACAATAAPASSACHTEEGPPPRLETVDLCSSSSSNSGECAAHSPLMYFRDYYSHLGAHPRCTARTYGVPTAGNARASNPAAWRQACSSCRHRAGAATLEHVRSALPEPLIGLVRHRKLLAMVVSSDASAR